MKNRSARKQGKSCGKVHRKHKKTEKRHNKWFQRGCQNEKNQSNHNNIQMGGGVNFLMGGMLKMNSDYKKYLKYKKKYLELKSYLR